MKHRRSHVRHGSFFSYFSGRRDNNISEYLRNVLSLRSTHMKLWYCMTVKVNCRLRILMAHISINSLPMSPVGDGELSVSVQIQSKSTIKAKEENKRWLSENDQNCIYWDYTSLTIQPWQGAQSVKNSRDRWLNALWMIWYETLNQNTCGLNHYKVSSWCYARLHVKVRETISDRWTEIIWGGGTFPSSVSYRLQCVCVKSAATSDNPVLIIATLYGPSRGGGYNRVTETGDNPARLNFETSLCTWRWEPPGLDPGCKSSLCTAFRNTS